ncbi:MAG: hypothetical protein Q9M21_05640 [Mariprofundaceae bacterium]|nr:hypothetical protein [Mariprofundaceae bacterium]
MSEESKQDSSEESSLSKVCHCKGGCTAKKALFVLCGALLVVGIVWLVITCPSCH